MQKGMHLMVAVYVMMMNLYGLMAHQCSGVGNTRHRAMLIIMHAVVNTCTADSISCISIITHASEAAWSVGAHSIGITVI
jgi:hypothetical protein